MYDNDMVDEKNKLLIMFVKDGYMITDQDGCQMFFEDGDKTSGFKSKFDAMKICMNHGYDYDVI